MRLYPRLERSERLIARANRLASMSISECAKLRALSDDGAVWSPTGGARASAADLRKLSDGLSEIARAHGYPEETRKRNTAPDTDWAIFLHRTLDTSPHEAASDGMWQFLTVCLVPDLVRWRWGAAKSDSTSDRWVTVKHHGRNTFGRLWWRAEIFAEREPGRARYELLTQLGEDELIQIMERPGFAGNRLLSRTTAMELMKLATANPGINRGEVLRDYQKRMLRLGAFIDFQVLDEEATADLAKEVYARTLTAMSRGELKKGRAR